MNYTPPIKGRYARKDMSSAFSQRMMQPQGGQQDTLFLASMISDIKDFKENVMETLDKKIVNVDALVNEKVGKIDGAFEDGVKKLEEKTIEILQEIQNLKQLQGDPGKDADEQKIIDALKDRIPKKDDIVSSVLSLIPKADTKGIIREVMRRIPENKASLKIIQEKIETDPMSVIEKIMELPPEKLEKLKLKSGNIDGLEQTMRAFQSQLSRGYLHGGGLSTVSHDSTLTGNGTPQSPLSVVASSTAFIDNEVVAGSGTAWTLGTVPVANSQHIYANGQRLTPIVDYTIAGAVITTVFSWSAGTVLADYRT